jgi:thymidylate kinase
MIDETSDHVTDTAERPAADAPHALDDAGWPARFIREFTTGLERARVRWVILRNHEDLPDRVGHDIDIIADPTDAETVGGVIRVAVRRCGLFLVRSYRGIEHRSFDVAASDLTGRLFLHVDLQTAMQYRGRRLIDAHELLADRRRAGEVWVPSPGMEGYALLLHAGLNKRALKPKYLARIAAIERDDPGAIERTAGSQLGPGLARRLAGVRTERDLLALRADLERAIDRRHRGNAWRRPSFEIRSTARQVGMRVRPRGLFVSFVGPDGSGKSSTVELLAEFLDAQPDVLPVRRVYLGSGDPLLPTRKLTRRLHGVKESAGAARQVRDVAPRRLRGALHVTADEIVRYWFQVRPRLAPHGLVLADRYAYDLFRVNNPMVRKGWFRRLATLMIPAPDLTFFLEGDPTAVAARKKELTVEETIRQQHAYRELASFVPNFRSLDLSVRDDAALRRVGVEILEAYARRNRGSADGHS